jgi:hypothetical protein
MKSIVFFFATLFACATFANNLGFNHNTPTVAQPNKTVTLNAGTMIYLELAEQVPTQKMTVGRIVKFSVKMNVKAEGKVVVRTGTNAIGRIKSVEQGSYNNPTEINIEITNVQAVDGTMIEVNGTEAIFIEDEKIPSLQQMTVRVMNDTDIEL